MKYVIFDQKDNPCRVELILDYVDFQYSNIFGEDWKKQERWVEKMDKGQTLAKIVMFIVEDLLRSGKIKDRERVLYVERLECPEEERRKGYGTMALRHICTEKRKKFDYVLTRIFDEGGLEFARAHGCDDYPENFWGRPLK